MALRDPRFLWLILPLLVTGCPGRSSPTTAVPIAVQPAPTLLPAPGCAGQPAPSVQELPDAGAFCVGFSADGTVGYLVLRPDQGNNLGIQRSYALYRVDLVGGEVALQERLADQSDSYAIGDDADDDDPADQADDDDDADDADRSDDADDQDQDQDQDYDGDARDRADQQMRDQLPRLDALIREQGLQACGAAAYQSGGWQAEVAGQTLILDTPDPDELEPDRPPAPVIAHWGEGPARALFELAQGDPEQSERVDGVFFHPCFPRLAVVVGIENDQLRIVPASL